MIDLSVTKEVTVSASQQDVFNVLSDLSKHKDLAGSGELVEIKALTQGPTGIGTMLEAQESIHLGDEHMEFAATSVVVAYDSPNSISWVPCPPIPIRRIQWWFTLSPAGSGTEIVQELEVDLGTARDMFSGTDNYKATRGADVIAGMDKTMDNFKKAFGG